MRIDENGNSCPETLGEYRDMCINVGVPNNRAVQYLNERIKETSEDDKVIISDLQIRQLLFPMLIIEATD